jgi:myo-inositol catabolism protein IolS
LELRRLGRSDMWISSISLGCWVMGKEWWGDADDSESIAAIHAAIDQGINFIDTAPAYGAGHSEEVLGKALEGKRDKVYIATKVGWGDLDPQKLPGALEASLKRLRTDYVDLYQIHWPHETIPISDSMAVIKKLQDQGKVRYIGVSNFNVPQMQEALSVARIESLQPPYNLFWRHIEKDILPFCIENEIGVIAYSPLAQGLLTGKFTKDTKFPENDIRSHALLFQGDIFLTALEAVEEMKPIAQKYGKTLGQVALNWLLCQPGITSAIVGARRPSQVEENVGGQGWKLEDEDLKTLDQLSKRVMSKLDDDPRMWRW